MLAFNGVDFDKSDIDSRIEILFQNKEQFYISIILMFAFNRHLLRYKNKELFYSIIVL